MSDLPGQMGVLAAALILAPPPIPQTCQRRLRPVETWIERHDRLQAVHLFCQVCSLSIQPGPGADEQDSWDWQLIGSGASPVGR